MIFTKQTKIKFYQARLNRLQARLNSIRCYSIKTRRSVAQLIIEIERVTAILEILTKPQLSGIKLAQAVAKKINAAKYQWHSEGTVHAKVWQGGQVIRVYLSVDNTSRHLQGRGYIGIKGDRLIKEIVGFGDIAEDLFNIALN